MTDLLSASILSLDEISQRQDEHSHARLRSLVGGKALNLARLVAVGSPVPAGFVVTSRAFEGALEAILARRASLREVAADIAESPMSEWLQALVSEAYQAMGAPAVAVRSSAADEDGNRQSFAGQQISVLNVHGEAALVRAIRQVWASLFSKDALLYRGRERLDQARPQMAVLVQVMVAAESAGVLFTADPLGHDPAQLMISAAFGLGEMVVQGGSADTFYVDRQSRGVRVELGDKRALLQAKEEGGLESIALSQAQGQSPALDEAQVSVLVDHALGIEGYFGRAQDIEFAFDGEGRVHILQARPITAQHGGAQQYWSSICLVRQRQCWGSAPGRGDSLYLVDYPRLCTAWI